MATMFGVHLVERGVISSLVLFEALECQEGDTPSLARLAMETRMMSARDAIFVLNRVRNDGDRFGPEAVSLGLLDEGQLAQLEELRAQRKPMLGEVLLRLGLITEHELDTELRVFREGGGTDYGLVC